MKNTEESAEKSITEESAEKSIIDFIYIYIYNVVWSYTTTPVVVGEGRGASAFTPCLGLGRRGAAVSPARFSLCGGIIGIAKGLLIYRLCRLT